MSNIIFKLTKFRKRKIKILLDYQAHGANPSLNRAHDVLLEVIKARYFGNEKLVQKILADEKDTRAKKKAAKKLLQCSFCPTSTTPLVSPQVKRVGRPRKKSADDSLSYQRGKNKSPDTSFDDKRSSISGEDRSVVVRGGNGPIAHSIQQLLMDKRVPNAATKKQQPHFAPPFTPDRFNFKPTFLPTKENPSDGMMYDVNFNWQMRKPWETDITPSCTSAGTNLNTSLEYSNSIHSHLNTYPHYSSFSGFGSQSADNGDLNTSEYLPDLDGLLSSNGPNLPLNWSESTSFQPSASSISHYPPIFIRQDLWPYQENTTNTPYQVSTPFSSQTPCQDLNNLSVWNSAQYPPYINNPTPGYYEEVVISETQNSDTLSAPENQEYVPPPSCYTSAFILPDNDNQVYWPRTDSSYSGTGANSLTTCPESQIRTNNNCEKGYWPRTDSNCSGIVGTSSINTCSGSQIRSNNSSEKGSLSHMRVSVVDTQEWTYEYSSSPGIFAQQFL